MVKIIQHLFSRKHQWRSFLVGALIIAMLISPLEAKAFDAADVAFIFGGAYGGAKVGLLACGIVTLTTVVLGVPCYLLVGITSIGGALLGYFAGDTIGAKVVDVIAAIVTAIAQLVVGIFINFSSLMLDISLRFNLLRVSNFGPVESLAALTTNMANLFLVAILIVIALATIVGIESYGVRRVLPVLIGLVLVVNFSTVFVGLVADAGNTAMRFFWTNSNLKDIPISKYVIRNMKITEFLSGNADTVRQLLAKTELVGVAKTSQAAVNATLNLVVLLIGLLAGYIFLRLAILMFLRLGVFWILIIIAPLVFILGIIPIGRGYLKEWWKQLLNWSFLGVIVFFFIFMGLLIWTELNKFILAIPIPGKGIVNLQPMAIVYVTPIVLFFFMYALNISKKMAGEAANAVVDSVIGLGKAVAVGGLTLGAGAVLAGTGGALLRNPFIKETYEKLQQSRSPFLQATGRRLEAAHKGAVEERQKRAQGTYSGLDALSNEDLIRRVRGGSFTKEQIVTAAQILDERRQTLPDDVAARALKLAPSINKDVEKKLKRSAPNVRYANEKFKDTGNIDVTSAYNYMKTQNVRALELAPEALATPAVAALLDLKQLYEVARRGTPQQLASISKGFEELAKQNNMQLNIASAIGKDRVEFTKSISEIAKKVREEAIFKAGAITEQDKPPDFTIGGAPPAP